MAKTISAGKYARRKEKYHNDPAHRAQLQKWAREGMRRRRGTKVKDCRENLTELSDIGSRRVCTIADEPHIRLCFTVTEAAEALMMSSNRLRIWIKQEVVPKPLIHADLGTGQMAAVYVLEEMRVLVNLIGVHRTQVSTILPNKHTELIDRLHAKMKRVRINTGVIDG